MGHNNFFMDMVNQSPMPINADQCVLLIWTMYTQTKVDLHLTKNETLRLIICKF